MAHKVAYKIYETKYEGTVYQVDGQNFEDTTREWELFEVTEDGLEWCNTYRTKRDAMNDIPRVHNLNRG